MISNAQTIEQLFLELEAERQKRIAMEHLLNIGSESYFPLH